MARITRRRVDTSTVSASTRSSTSTFVLAAVRPDVPGARRGDRQDEVLSAFGEVHDAAAKFMSQYSNYRGSSRRLSTSAFQTMPSTSPAVMRRPPCATSSRRRTTTTPTLDSNVYENPTFLGNHDMGRVDDAVRQGIQRWRPARPGAPGELLDIPHSRPARRLLRRRAGASSAPAATRTPARTCSPPRSQYAGEANLTGPSGARDRYATTAPLYLQIRKLESLRRTNPRRRGRRSTGMRAVAAGITPSPGIDRATGIRVPVVANNATTGRSATSTP